MNKNNPLAIKQNVLTQQNMGGDSEEERKYNMSKIN
jgi:hypothetical protein